MTDSSTALEKPTGVLSLVPARILTDNEEVTALCVQLTRAGANIVGPKVTTLGQAQGFAFSAIQLNPNDDRECYCDPGAGMSKTERALTKNALDQIANLSGINWTIECRDERLEEHHVVFHAHGTYRDQVGETRTITGTREVDLRSPPIGKDAKGMSPKQLQRAQKYIIPMAESKAKNRAIRSALSLKNKYSATELARPFVVLRPVAMPDTSDPFVRRAVALKALGAEHLLFPQARRSIEGEVEIEPAVAVEPDPKAHEPDDGLQHTRELLKRHRERYPHDSDREREPGEDDEPVVDFHGTAGPGDDTVELSPNTEAGRRADINEAMGDRTGADDDLFTIEHVMQIGKQWMASAKELSGGKVLCTADSAIAVTLKRCGLSDGRLRPRLIVTSRTGSTNLMVEEVCEVVDTQTGEVG